MGAAAIFQVDHVFADAELPAVRFEQSADLMVFTHLNHTPQRLRRFGNADWRWDDAPIGVGPAAPATVTAVATDPNTAEPNHIDQFYQYAVTSVDEATGRESVAMDSNTVTNDLNLLPGSPGGSFNTVTWTAVTGAEYYRVYRVRNGARGYVAQVPGDQLSFIDDNIEVIFSDSPPILLNPFSDGKNPACVTLHEGRLAFGRLPDQPNALLLSQTDDLFNFDKSEPTRATDALGLGLRARRVNAVQHLVSLGGLVALTSDTIFAIPSGESALTATTAQSKVQGYQGAGLCRPEAVVDILFYTTSKGSSIRTLNYQFEADGYRGTDITVFAPHLFSGFTIQWMAWAEHPASVMYCGRDDGHIVALTWQAEQQVWGWTHLETAGNVESGVAISENSTDVLYLLVNRTINGETRRYVERLAYPEWIEETWDTVQDAVVLDCAVQYSGEPATTFDGLDEYEGLTLNALADGYVVRDLLVTDGVVTLPDPVEEMTLGIPFEARIRTLPMVIDTREGTSKGRKQAPSKVLVEVMNTRGGEYGKGALVGTESATEMYPFPFPDGLEEVHPDPLYSGVFETDGFPPTDWKEALITLRQRDPLPMVILSVTPEIVVGG